MNTSAELSVREIQAALDAGPTEGPWEAAARGDYGDFDGDSRVILGDDMRLAVVQTNGRPETEANAEYIAACNPANMRNVLALIQSQAAEIERMRSGLADLKWRVDDIRDRLLGGGTGHSVYGIDEWSEPAVNLKLAGKKIDTILATTQSKG